MKNVLIVVAILIVVGGGVLLLLKPWESKTDNVDNSQNQPTQQENTSDDNQSGSEEPVTVPDAVTILYTDDGFEPQSYEIKAGGTLTIVNNSAETLQFSSDPHPAHTENSELNADPLEPGESTQITLNRKGTWGVHNHENSLHKATVVVE